MPDEMMPAGTPDQTADEKLDAALEDETQPMDSETP